MNLIYKYTLAYTPEVQTLKLSKDHILLNIAFQNDTPVVWVMFDPDKEDDKEDEIDVNIACIWTGRPVEYNIDKYLGTIQLPNGLVNHYFTLKNT